jgi:hypothetical protein
VNRESKDRASNPKKPPRAKSKAKYNYPEACREQIEGGKDNNTREHTWQKSKKKQNVSNYQNSSSSEKRKGGLGGRGKNFSPFPQDRGHE